MDDLGRAPRGPAIVAAAVLATARALGEAIMLSMVSGSVGFAPNPLDGLTFFLEPARPLAATIVDNAEGLSVKPFGQTLYAFAAVLLVSSLFLSFAGWAAKQPLRKYSYRRRGAMSAHAQAPAPVRRTAAGPRPRPRPSWSRGDRIGAGALLGRRASCSALIAARDRRSTCWSAGLQYLQPRRCSSPTRWPTSTRRKTGGFLDPLDRHGHPDRPRHR